MGCEGCRKMRAEEGSMGRGMLESADDVGMWSKEAENGIGMSDECGI